MQKNLTSRERKYKLVFGGDTLSIKLTDVQYSVLKALNTTRVNPSCHQSFEILQMMVFLRRDIQYMWSKLLL